MKIKSRKYRWCWHTLALWRMTEYKPVYSPVFDAVVCAGESNRIFTLRPDFLWQSWQNR
jgi:hypothetical protein